MNLTEMLDQILAKREAEAAAKRQQRQKPKPKPKPSAPASKSSRQQERPTEPVKPSPRPKLSVVRGPPEPQPASRLPPPPKAPQRRLTDAEKISAARIPLTPVDELHPLLREDLDYIQLHRCVLAVYKENTSTSKPAHERLSQAFAICIKSLQNNGYIKPGTREPTEEGRRRSYFKAVEPDAVQKQVEYRELLVEAKDSRARAKETSLEAGLRGRTGAANRKGGSAGMTKKELEDALQQIREAAEPVFSCSTVWGDCRPEAPSAGHCFMLSMAVQDMLGGQILFGEVETEDGSTSHYWNKLGPWEFDLTGDQFQEPRVQLRRGKIRPSIAVFDRDRYEVLDQEFNKQPMKIYRRFCKRLIKELDRQSLCEYVDHLKQMEAA